MSRPIMLFLKISGCYPVFHGLSNDSWPHPPVRCQYSHQLLWNNSVSDQFKAMPCPVVTGNIKQISSCWICRDNILLGLIITFIAVIVVATIPVMYSILRPTVEECEAYRTITTNANIAQ